MAIARVKKTHSSYNLMFSLLRNDPTTIREVYAIMKEEQVQPTFATYSLLIKSHVSSQLYDEAINFYKEALENNTVNFNVRSSLFPSINDSTLDYTRSLIKILLEERKNSQVSLRLLRSNFLCDYFENLIAFYEPSRISVQSNRLIEQFWEFLQAEQCIPAIIFLRKYISYLQSLPESEQTLLRISSVESMIEERESFRATLVETNENEEQENVEEFEIQAPQNEDVENEENDYESQK
eukprot:c2912_g1_i1.p1 GENE.c2912_g1_i1~~c2912_g1_i1.p1  ORF type:complete len:238 (-),score=103.11 c2912_g1_i1:6-719(-)